LAPQTVFRLPAPGERGVMLVLGAKPTPPLASAKSDIYLF
jgi:hypothetical protein